MMMVCYNAALPLILTAIIQIRMENFYCHLQWDIADTPRWISLPLEGYYREADGILIVYNVTDKVHII